MPSLGPIAVAITGAAGYLGTLLSAQLAADPSVGRLLLVDRHDAAAPTAGPAGGTEQLRLDLAADGPDGLAGQLEGIDVVVHLAWEPPASGGPDETNLRATRHLLEACAARRVRRVLVASSTSAYGAWPDNPLPIPEEQWVRVDQACAAGRHKALLEGLCRQWAEHNPYATMVVVRPCPVLGPARLTRSDRANLLPRLFLVPEGLDTPLQFVHEDDAIRALVELCRRGGAGAYNLAADGTVGAGELAALFGRRSIPAPAGALRELGEPWGLLDLASAGRDPGAVELLRFPCVADNRRLKATLGFAFGHDSLSTLTELARCLRGG